MKGEAMGRKQRGITLIGFAISLIVVCFFAYMAMVLGPAYSEYYGVRKAMNFVAANSMPQDTNFEKMRASLDKQFNVGYVESVSGKTAKLIRDKGGNILSIEYEVRKRFVYNIDFMIMFKYDVPLGSKTAGD
jgi:Tfp pilus assembly protein PilE